jgi:hypothetical protein
MATTPLHEAMPNYYIIAVLTKVPPGSKFPPIWMALRIDPALRRKPLDQAIGTVYIDSPQALVISSDLPGLTHALHQKPQFWWDEALLDRASVQILRLRPQFDPLRMEGF